MSCTLSLRSSYQVAVLAFLGQAAPVWSCCRNKTLRPKFLSCIFVHFGDRGDVAVHMKESSAGGPYEKPGKAPAASLMLLVTVRVSLHREEDTGRCVNSGSKCLRSVGPLWKTKRGRRLDLESEGEKVIKHFITARPNAKHLLIPVSLINRFIDNKHNCYWQSCVIVSLS